MIPSFPFVPQAALVLPRSAREAKVRAATLNREAREARAASDREREARVAEVLRASRGGLGERRRVEPARPPAAARKPTPPLHAVAPPRTATAAAIDPQEVYRARNAPIETCGTCGARHQGPVHGLIVDDIRPAAPPRTHAQMVVDTYSDRRRVTTR